MTELTADLLVADSNAQGGTRHLDVDDFKTPATGGSTEATVAAFKSANHTDLAALSTALGTILAKLTADPATGAKQDTLHADLGELLVLHTDLAAILAKESADPSTGANQASANTKLDTLHTDVGAVATSLGTDGSSAPAMPGSASGVRGWLRGIYAALGSPAQDATISTAAGAAGTSPPALAASATGIIGWLRKIVDTLTGGIGVTGTFWQATQPVSGTVTANAGTGTFLVDSESTYSVQTRDGNGNPLTYTKNGHTYTATYVGLNLDTVVRNS